MRLWAFPLLFLPSLALAQGQKYIESQPTFQSEGRNPVSFNVSCATASWTLVIASATISRSTFMESISSNTYSVCLNPVSAPSTQCAQSAVGIELMPTQGYTDYSKASWWCSASSGTITQTIKGVRTQDKGDYGNIGAASQQ